MIWFLYIWLSLTLLGLKVVVWWGCSKYFVLSEIEVREREGILGGLWEGKGQG